jgi:two-component system, cell cycle response regulator DivK
MAQATAPILDSTDPETLGCASKFRLSRCCGLDDSTRLERCGDFEVLTAEDSEQGCKLAVADRPDVILMDLEMPVMDRWESVRTLKKDPRTRNIPIIGMSAYAEATEREKAIATGCDEFDAKPIEFENLLATVRHVLTKPK